MRRMGPFLKFLALALLICLLWSADARKPTKPNPQAVHKQHDAAHASRLYKPHTDSRSGRTGVTPDRRVSVAGRKLQQGSTVTVPGMNLCVSAADAANVIVGAHATQLTVSNAIFKAGRCDLASYQAGITGLQWGVVQSWPADHVMASISNNTGEPPHRMRHTSLFKLLNAVQTMHLLHAVDVSVHHTLSSGLL